MGTVIATPKKTLPCPICGNPSVKVARPFCSKVCADRDLGKWLSEDYRIPTEEGAQMAQISEDEEGEGEN